MSRPKLNGLIREGLTSAELMPFLHDIHKNHEALTNVAVCATRYCKGEAPLETLVRELRVAGFLSKGFKHGQVQS